MSRRQSLFADIVDGAVAGAVATWVMGKVTTALYERTGERVIEEEEDARDGKTAHGVAAKKAASAVGRELSDGERERYGAAVHWALGAAAGAMYGFLRPRYGTVSAANGLAFGTAFWLLVDEGGNPVLGLTPGPRAFPWQTHGRGLAGHLVFGAVADTLLRALQPSAAGGGDLHVEHQDHAEFRGPRALHTNTHGGNGMCGSPQGGGSPRGERPAADRQTYLARHSDSAAFPRTRTALLVIDPVNDFLSEGGAAWDLTKNTVRMNDVVGHLKQAIEGSRARGIPVLFGPMAYTEEDYAEHALQRRSGINRIMFERKMFLAGSWGADFHPDLRPAAGDVVLKPHKGTDVFETDLPEHLDRLGTTHLVIAGMTANLCCESTGRHATEHGYDVTFLSDAIGSESVPSYEASIRLNYPLIANGVMEVEEFFAALDGSDHDRAIVREGDTVKGSDHLDIGTVERVERASDSHDAHLVVPRGMIFEKDTYIPVDAVVRRAGDTVFINVPKLVVGMMPWSEPPTRRDRREKEGPASGDVQKLYRSRSPSGAVSAEGGAELR